ncbi:zinc finger 618 [Pelobates cultripes]|uniref:Zinc finger 618 n=1 Tax=Pelobates cultripes TaxID=61616 RepID=A0AAD1R7W7_PELCU|nr:zinc finger 618 [Pelobates cultripes]
MEGLSGHCFVIRSAFQCLFVQSSHSSQRASIHIFILTDNFRYTCDICGKKYKYYSCFQEHRDLHAVDDTYIHMMVTSGDAKEEDPEPFLKLGPKTGNYTCEFCGKQYKYYTPYQEHVALHAPLKGTFSHDIEHKVPNNYEETNSNSQHSSGSSRTHRMSDMVVAGNITAWQKEPANQIIPSSFPLLQSKFLCSCPCVCCNIIGIIPL